MTLPAIVLVRPRNPNNIGAAARAMANFGFLDLRVVDPHPPVWREARSAVGAEALLKKARTYRDLSEALADRAEAWATSCLKSRRPRLPARDLPGFNPGKKAAIVFGSEKTGLTSSDMQYCRGIVRVPTLASCPSMNLAASVAVVCYELRRGVATPKTQFTLQEKVVSNSELERLLEQGERALAKVGYRPKMSQEQRRSKLRTLLNRRGISADEAGFLFEVARRMHSPRVPRG